MTHRSRASAAAIVVALLIATVSASSASAEFHSSSAHTIFSASQTSSIGFTVGAGFGTITCSNYSLAATSVTKTLTSPSFTPSLSGCKDSFGRAVDIAVNECKYTFHSTSGSGSTSTGNMAIECPAGKSITTQVTNGSNVVICTVTIGSQTGITPMHFENGASDIKLTYQAKNIKSTTSGGFLNCGVSNGEYTGGSLSGAMTVTGIDTTGSPVSISVTAGASPPLLEITSTYTTKSGVHDHTTFSADQTTPYAFSAAGGAPSVACEEVSFEGTSETGEDTAIVVSPSYVGCEDSLGRNADIVTNGCVYELTPTKEVSSGTYSGTADIECGAKPIEIKTTSASEEVICTTTIGSQNGVGPVHFTNMTEKAPTDLTIGFEATNVANTTSGGSTKCGVADGAHIGSYQGKSTMNGESCIPADVAVVKE